MDRRSFLERAARTVMGLFVARNAPLAPELMGYNPPPADGVRLPIIPPPGPPPKRNGPNVISADPNAELCIETVEGRLVRLGKMKRFIVYLDL